MQAHHWCYGQIVLHPQLAVFGVRLAAGPVVLVAIAGVIGWVLLITIKWLIVTLLIAFGVALIVVPFFVGGRDPR